MKKTVFFFLSLSLFLPLLSQTKKPVKKSSPVKATVTKTTAKTVKAPVKPAPASKSVSKKAVTPVAKTTVKPTVKPAEKKPVVKSTGTVVKKTNTPRVLRSDCIKYSTSKKVKTALQEAKTYEGVPYKYGGNTRKGIDCSALVKSAFKKAQVELPRRSIEMSNKGTPVKVNKIKEGDLLFFATSKGKINHVAIVYKIKEGGVISFIHASSSKGVMISDLKGSYWPARFVKAKRIA